ncbi:MAG: DNA-binding response regulator [Spirochaetales bacterium]|nr:DNA-binding response regulator [Spirochaetales bacterium]
MKQNHRRILVVEDDAVILMALCDRLRSEGYTVESARDGKSGAEAAAGSGCDLIILDIMLPEKDGLEVCRYLRSRGVEIPVLMLTARNATSDKVIGLRTGADDYLTKPFEMMELLARVEALLRRQDRIVNPRDRYAIGRYRLDARGRELRVDRKVIPLTAYEFKLLKFLCEHRGEIFERDTLLDQVWGYESEVFSRTVDVYIASLRKKLNDSKRQEHIVTVRGQGYKLAD